MGKWAKAKYRPKTNSQLLEACLFHEYCEKRYIIEEQKRARGYQEVKDFGLGSIPNIDQTRNKMLFRNPDLSEKDIINVIDAFREQANNPKYPYHYAPTLYASIFDNPNITSKHLFRYIGSQYVGGLAKNGIDGYYSLRLHRALTHPAYPKVLMGKEYRKDKLAALYISFNPAISNSVAKKIASEVPLATNMLKSFKEKVCLNLINNPNVTQDVISSLVPNEKGIWLDGKKISVALLKALAINLTDEDKRQRCLTLLAQRSKGHGSQVLVTYYSQDETALAKILGSASRGIANVAANRTEDPDSSKTIVALRTQGRDTRKPAKPKVRQ